MRIAIALDKARLFRWHLDLATGLKDQGHDVSVRFRDMSEPLPTSLTAILDFDRVRERSGPDRFSTRLLPAAFAFYAGDEKSTPDITIDLSTSSKPMRIDGRVLRAEYDGTPKDSALFHSLLAGRAPDLRLRDTGPDGLWPIGLPAIETPSRIAPSLDQTASRLLEGITRIIAQIANDEPAPGKHVDPGTPGGRQSIMTAASKFATRRAARKFRNARDRLIGNAPRWHVAWRTAQAEAPQLGGRTLSDYQILPDGGGSYYADPFIFATGGTRHVFLEELPAETGIGIISHFVIDDRCKASKPKPVLNTGQHLSYPQVFARDDAIWMLPESAAAGGLDLYRAERFPDRWIKHTRLIEGRVHDATLFEHDGLLWIAAGTEAYQSSTWDALSLYFAETLSGPWRPHAKNPVVIDARFARPAGPLWTSGGALYRPAQNCSGGYGGQISVRRIVKLTTSEFLEDAAGHISFDANYGLLGPHTIHCAAGLEVLDLYARPGALRRSFSTGT